MSVVDHSTDEQKIKWYDDRTLRDRLEHDGYPHFFVSLILHGTDVAKLVELHREKGMAYALAFDARVEQNGFEPGNLTDIQNEDIKYELEKWRDDESTLDDTVTVHLKREQELANQIKDILEPYKYAWWQMSILNRAGADY
jgi:hypothetical protein